MEEERKEPPKVRQVTSPFYYSIGDKAIKNAYNTWNDRYIIDDRQVTKVLTIYFPQFKEIILQKLFKKLHIF